MAEPIAPTVGSVPAGSEPVKTLERQVAPQYETNTTDYVSAFKNLANTPTLLGSIGTQMATSASVALNQKLGKYFGANPSGELFPAITNADKAFENSYNSQAATTLGLRANKMLNEAQEDLSKNYRLSPGQIQEYNSNMAEGLKKITELAPEGVKTQLENQLGHQLLNSTHQLQEQRLNQEKEISRQNAEVSRMQLTDKLMEAQRSGNPALASSYRTTIEQSIASGLASGAMSPLQAQTARDSVEMSYLTGAQMNGAMIARQQGGGALETYLAAMPGMRPDNVSHAKWDNVMRNTMSYVGQMDNVEQRNQSLEMSQGNLEISNGTFNDERAAHYKSILTPTNFNNMMTHYYANQRKVSKGQYASMELAANYGNADAHVGQSKETENGAFDNLVRMKQDNAKRLGQPISQSEAEFQVAASSATPVPKLIERMNVDAKNGNAQQLDAAIQTYENLSKVSPNKVVGVDDQALMMMTLYPMMLGNPEVKTADEAVQKARDAVFKKDKTTYDLNKQMTSDYFNKHVQSSQINSWAINNSGLPTGIPMQNQAEFNGHFKAMFAAGMELSDGNIDASMKVASESIRRMYSVSMVNGVRQISKYGIENTVELDDSAPLIQQDIMNRLAPQFQQRKESFDQGGSQSYWRFKPRVTYDEYAKAKLETQDRTSWLGIGKDFLVGANYAHPDIKEQLDKIRDFEDGKPIEVEQVFKGGEVKTYNLNIKASPIMQKNPKTGDIIGDYDVQAVYPKTGIPETMSGFWGGTGTSPTYRPDNTWIRENYASLYGHGLTWNEYAAQREKERAAFAPTAFATGLKRRNQNHPHERALWE